MGTLEMIQQKAFLGREFLTWLWFRSDESPIFEMKDGRKLEMEMLGPIALEANYGDARVTSLKGESPATSPESSTALLQGKKLSRARMRFSREAVDWTFTLDGATMNVSGLMVPRPGQLPFEEVLEIRLDFMLDLEAILAELYGSFLQIRLDSGPWEKELKKIQEWVGGR